MKEKKIRHTVSVWESTEKRLLEAYSERQPTCRLNVFISDLINLGLKLDEELNRRHSEAVHAITGVKATVIQFPERA